VTRALAGLAGIAAAVAGAAAYPAHGGAIAAFPDGPPPARTGGFGEQSCRACHFDNPSNEEGGELAITGVPAAYAAGGRYRATIVLRRNELHAGGFQLAARFADGPSAGRQAGALRAVDERAQVAAGGNDAATAIQYAAHTRPGIVPSADGRIEWVIEWTAPATVGGAVVFHAAALAANGDDSALGDLVYTTRTTAHAAKP